jgi:hypothetical protein
MYVVVWTWRGGWGKYGNGGDDDGVDSRIGGSGGRDSSVENGCGAMVILVIVVVATVELGVDMVAIKGKVEMVVS